MVLLSAGFRRRALDCPLHGGVFLVPLGLELLAENQRGLSEVTNLGLGLKKLVGLVETFSVVGSPSHDLYFYFLQLYYVLSEYTSPHWCVFNPSWSAV